MSFVTANWLQASWLPKEQPLANSDEMPEISETEEL